MSKHRNTVIVTVSSALLLLTTAGAFASTAEAMADVSIHSNHSKGSRIVDTLYEGERVTVRSCDGNWCYISHPGPDGWVPVADLEQVGRGSDDAPVVVFQGGGFGRPHKPYPPVVVDPGPKKPIIIGGIIHQPPLTLDPGSSQGGGGGGISTGGGGSGTHSGGTVLCIVGHPCHPAL